MGKVIEMSKVNQSNQQENKAFVEEMYEAFLDECCTPKVTGDPVYRIEFTGNEDGLERVTKIEEVSRMTALEDPGTMQIGSLTQAENRWWLTGFLMEEGDNINYFYASFKDLNIAKAKELILSNDLAIAWL